MRRVMTRVKRSTAPSKAWMPNARPQCWCQAPQPRSGAPKGAGLDSGTVAAAQSAMPSIAACRRTDCKQHFHWRRPIRRSSATVPNLHQLDGRDRVVPFYDEHGIRLSRMLTDRGTEFCGTQSHEYELYLAVEDVDHSR